MNLGFINNKDLAFKRVIKELCGFYNSNFILSTFNNGRHIFLKSVDKDIPNFYVLFKREWFNSFNVWFPSFVNELPLYKGDAQSINFDYLKKAISLNADYFLVVMGDGSVFRVGVGFWLKFCEKYNLIREQKVSNSYGLGDYTGNKVSVNEVTYCLPRKCFERL